MKSTSTVGKSLSWIVLVLCALAMVGWGSSDPELDKSSTTKKLESLPRVKGVRKVVTIYEFRSGVPEVTAMAATDMFTTALIKSGAFAVAERQRLSQGVIQEKQLNASGQASGSIATQQLKGADYIFEGTVSEANANASKTGLGGTLKGLGVETSGEKATMGLDVRVIDASNGEVLDSVNVRKAIKSGGVSLGGVGAFVQSMTKKNLQGADIGISHEKREGVDEALRACIEQAVYEIVKRYGKESGN